MGSIYKKSLILDRTSFCIGPGPGWANGAGWAGMQQMLVNRKGGWVEKVSGVNKSRLFETLRKSAQEVLDVESEGEPHDDELWLLRSGL